MATAIWLAGSLGFSFYVSHFGSYNKTYGSVAAIAILLTWFLLSAYVVISAPNSTARWSTRRRATRPPERRTSRSVAAVRITPTPSPITLAGRPSALAPHPGRSCSISAVSATRRVPTLQRFPDAASPGLGTAVTRGGECGAIGPRPGARSSSPTTIPTSALIGRDFGGGGVSAGAVPYGRRASRRPGGRQSGRHRHGHGDARIVWVRHAGSTAEKRALAKIPVVVMTREQRHLAAAARGRARGLQTGHSQPSTGPREAASRPQFLTQPR